MVLLFIRKGRIGFTIVLASPTLTVTKVHPTRRIDTMSISSIHLDDTQVMPCPSLWCTLTVTLMCLYTLGIIHGKDTVTLLSPIQYCRGHPPPFLS